MKNVCKIKTDGYKNSKILEFYDNAMSELKVFYNLNWVDNTPVIYLVDSREEFDIISGYKTEDWVVGRALSYNKLLLLSPESYEKESSHTYSDDEYYSLIKHELSHLFYQIISNNSKPVWLNEGFAIYSSGQLKMKKKPEVFSVYKECFYNGNSKIYAEAGYIVEGLVKEYGKDKVLDFVKILKGINSEKEFDGEFSRYFSIDLDLFVNNNV